VSEGPKQLKGRKLGDRRVRIERPHAEYFRYTGKEGTLVAKESASAPRTAAGRALARTRAVLFGRPLSIHDEITERLSKLKALAIFSSDPISSSAYATEEILRVLVLAGAGALLLSLPIAIAIALLIAVVSTSYRQEVYAYSSGGGDYAVARRNLPNIFALVVAGALLVDYVMTVAVSTASAVEQVISAAPGVADLRIEIGVGAIVLITLGNLRGLRESGNIFAIPTYLFVGSALIMIAVGVFLLAISVPVGQVALYLIPIIDAFLISLGLLLLLGRNPFQRLPGTQVPLVANPYGQAYVYGVMLGPLALPCAGPFLVALLALSVGLSDAALRLGTFVVFGLGFGLPLLVLSVLAGARQQAVVRWTVRHHRAIEIVAGVVLIAVALYDLRENWESLAFTFGF